MYSIGSTYVDPETNIHYKCTAVITVSPTLMNKKELKTSMWEPTVGGGGSSEPPKTIVLEDENGNKVVAVLVDGEVDFTATANDIREGMVAAGDEGVIVGEKFIPSYLVSEGFRIIMPGSEFTIKIADYDLYDYTKLQGLICPFNTSIVDSVSCEKVIVNDNLYNVLSTVSIGMPKRNSENKTIDLGFSNATDAPYLIRYFTYKEVY